jgi:hypothetical protein
VRTVQVIDIKRTNVVISNINKNNKFYLRDSVFVTKISPEWKMWIINSKNDSLILVASFLSAPCVYTLQKSNVNGSAHIS